MIDEIDNVIHHALKRDRVYIVGDRASGKTSHISLAANKLASNIPNSKIYVVNKTFRLCENNLYNFESINFPSKGLYVRQTKHKIKYANGSEIYFGNSNADNMRGMTINYILCDEAFDTYEEYKKFNQSALPTLARNGGGIILTVDTYNLKPYVDHLFYDEISKRVYARDGSYVFDIRD